MEQVLAASKQSLIGALEFGGPPPAADYVTSRSDITIFPLGGNTYSPTGVKMIRFNLGTQSGAFLDMSTLAIQASLNEKSGAANLTVLGPNLGALFSEMRIYMGGVLVEQTSFLNRCEELEEVLRGREAEWPRQGGRGRRAGA